MNTETQFNDDSKDLPTFMVSGWCGSPEVNNIVKEPSWRIYYTTPAEQFGVAINYTYIDDEGKMWVGNEEYESQVNFCPITGKEAPIKVDEPNIE
jgi:hypothetical protein